MTHTIPPQEKLPDIDEYHKGRPVRGVLAWAGKWTARAESIQILQAWAVTFQAGLRE